MPGIKFQSQICQIFENALTRPPSWPFDPKFLLWTTNSLNFQNIMKIYNDRPYLNSNLRKFAFEKPDLISGLGMVQTQPAYQMIAEAMANNIVAPDVRYLLSLQRNNNFLKLIFWKNDSLTFGPKWWCDRPKDPQNDHKNCHGPFQYGEFEFYHQTFITPLY